MRLSYWFETAEAPTQLLWDGASLVGAYLTTAVGPPRRGCARYGTSYRCDSGAFWT